MCTCVCILFLDTNDDILYTRFSFSLYSCNKISCRAFQSGAESSLQIVSNTPINRCSALYNQCPIIGHLCVCAKSLHSCLTLYYPMDRNLPCFSVHGILQARILEWIAMSSSRGSSWPRNQIHVSYTSCICRWILYHQHPLGSPLGHLDSV